MLTAVVGVLAFGPAPGKADVLVRKQVEADAYRPPASGPSSVEPVDWPADGSVVEVWTDGERVRRDEKDVSFVVRPGEGSLWIVYHRDHKVAHLAWPPRYAKHRSMLAESLGTSATDLLPFQLEGEIATRHLDRDPFQVQRAEARVADGPGAVVGWVLALQQPGTEVRYAERVVGIEEHDGGPAGGYEPPADYQKVEFSPGSLAGR